MKIRKGKYFFSQIKIIFLGIFFTFTFNSELSYRTIIGKIDLSTLDLSRVEDGDIIFRRGIGLASDIILSTDASCPFTHVGIIQKINDNIFVIHSSPTDNNKQSNFIEKELLSNFLSREAASDFAIRRIIPKTNLKKVLRFADSLYKAKVDFDDEFDLLNSDKFYCTELVYKSYLYSGVDLTNGKLDTLLIPIGKNPYLLPGTLLKSTNLKKLNLKKGEVYEN